MLQFRIWVNETFDKVESNNLEGIDQSTIIIIKWYIYKELLHEEIKFVQTYNKQKPVSRVLIKILVRCKDSVK